MTEFCDRKELEFDNIRQCYPVAAYTLDNMRKKEFLTWVEQLKMPDGYMSNLGQCVNMSKYQMFGMKSHDCHVFMQRLIPIGFRELLPKKIWEAITELSNFFRRLTSKVVSLKDMELLEAEIPVILCKLETIFVPGFFNSMEHLPVHLPYETRIAGPVQFRWMYPFERQDDGGPRLTSDIEIKVFSHPCRLQGKPKKWYLLPHERQAIQAYFLLNVPECDTFISIFEETLKREHPLISDIEVASHLQRNFTSWFAQYVTEQDNIPKIYKDISHGPLVEVTSYNKCFINGHRFYTEKYGAKKASYNSGVCVDGGGLEYYGHIQEILEIEFPGLPIKRCTIFNCEWYDPTSGVGTKKHGRYNLVEVNKKKKLHTYEPFILAIQATQVCYLPFPSMKKDKANWLAVCRVRPRGWIDMSGEIVESQEEVDTYQNAVVEPCTIKTPTEGEQLYLASTDGGSGIPIDNSDGSDTDDEEIFFETFSTSELNQLSPTSSDYDVSAE
ncbi:uncharacterized protein LOC127266224 isoform X1 [Andrographis paniculata]|uniref:uncharacterized protein LOC127266224 isoform X1 n=1 Tax=Andrographis paniculata TaxID=175694 RepID=UPI0021E87C5D|nr:uncharacterized protein LOC127266224 isoform X1 [Andrographis paniculata]XP_051152348.1 uncharacterized protein LOC127266224 isoform X1 [Andrographis paniculata]